MAEDESQTKKAPEISQEGKEPLHPGQHRSKDWKPIKIKPEEQAEAERLFFLFFPEASHWEPPSILLPFDPITYVPYLKEVALAILGTGIIGEKGLKGHAGHKKIYPLDRRELRELIGALVEKDFKYRDVTFFPGDILKRFDNHFNSMTALARLAGVTERKIKDAWEDLQKWRERISLAVAQGKWPSNWRELTKTELISSWKYRPRSEAHAFAIVFLHYAPEAKDNRIALWVNAILKSLGQPTVSIYELREYIKKERQRRPYLSRKASNNSP
jgi:hypothetical protein